MRNPIYNRWLWLFMAMYSAAWAEGKASPGRSICMYTTQGMHCGSNTSRMQRCPQAELWATALVPYNGSAHPHGMHTVFPRGLQSSWDYYSSLCSYSCFCSNKPLGIPEEVWSPQILGRKKDTTEEPECRVTLAKGYIQALSLKNTQPRLGGLGGFYFFVSELNDRVETPSNQQKAHLFEWLNQDAHHLQWLRAEAAHTEQETRKC